MDFELVVMQSNRMTHKVRMDTQFDTDVLEPETMGKTSWVLCELGYSHEVFVLWWHNSFDGSQGMLALYILMKHQYQGTLPTNEQCMP